MKLDLMKAYESVASSFLFDVMESVDFPRPFIHWVNQCETSTMFSANINGELEG